MPLIFVKTYQEEDFRGLNDEMLATKQIAFLLLRRNQTLTNGRKIWATRAPGGQPMGVQPCNEWVHLFWKTSDTTEEAEPGQEVIKAGQWGS